ncbi:MAG TPA: MFS transporter, partial [Actinomycetales bacterium]|nr:MFS transporter [Actinomycetales bacterium]
MERNGTAVDPGTRVKLVGILMAGQILGGLGVGAALSVGALMAHQVTGSVELSGMAATLTTLGAALAAVPLAAL